MQIKNSPQDFLSGNQAKFDCETIKKPYTSHDCKVLNLATGLICHISGINHHRNVNKESKHMLFGGEEFDFDSY